MANFMGDPPRFSLSFERISFDPVVIRIYVLSGMPLTSFDVSAQFCQSRLESQFREIDSWQTFSARIVPAKSLNVLSFDFLQRSRAVLEVEQLFCGTCQIAIPTSTIKASRQFRMQLHQVSSDQTSTAAASILRQLRNSTFGGKGTRVDFGFMLSDQQIQARVDFISEFFEPRMQHEADHDALHNCFLLLKGGFDCPLI